MIFEGDRSFPLSPSRIWAKLRDVRFLVRCIPDTSSGDQADQDRATCTVRPGFAFVRGSLEVTLQLAEAVEDKILRFSVTSAGIGSSADVEAVLTFIPPDLSQQAADTRVHWKAEVKKLGGLLKAVPAGLIRGAAQKVIEDVWTGIAEQLKSSA